MVRHVTSRVPDGPLSGPPVFSDPVSSLWTPDGEHKVGRPSEPPSSEAGRPAGGAPGRPSGPPSGPSARAAGSEPEEEELEEVREQLLEAPVEVVVANHAYGLFELAALHLSAKPPHLPQARLAVDALGALVEGLGDRLGQVEVPMKEALAQIRLAYVQISEAAGRGDPAGGQESAEPPV